MMDTINIDKTGDNGYRTKKCYWRAVGIIMDHSELEKFRLKNLSTLSETVGISSLLVHVEEDPFLSLVNLRVKKSLGLSLLGYRDGQNKKIKIYLGSDLGNFYWPNKNSVPNTIVLPYPPSIRMMEEEIALPKDTKYYYSFSTDDGSTTTDTANSDDDGRSCKCQSPMLLVGPVIKEEDICGPLLKLMKEIELYRDTMVRSHTTTNNNNNHFSTTANGDYRNDEEDYGYSPFPPNAPVLTLAMDHPIFIKMETYCQSYFSIDEII